MILTRSAVRSHKFVLAISRSFPSKNTLPFSVSVSYPNSFTSLATIDSRPIAAVASNLNVVITTPSPVVHYFRFRFFFINHKKNTYEEIAPGGRFRTHRMWVMQLVRQDVAVTAAKGERQASSVASLPAGSPLSRYPAGVAAFCSFY